MLFSRPEPETHPHSEEVAIRLSILPIRLNIDQVRDVCMDAVGIFMFLLAFFCLIVSPLFNQDSFYFLFEFFSQVSDVSSISCESNKIYSLTVVQVSLFISPCPIFSPPSFPLSILLFVSVPASTSLSRRETCHHDKRSPTRRRQSVHQFLCVPT